MNWCAPVRSSKDILCLRVPLFDSFGGCVNSLYELISMDDFHSEQVYQHPSSIIRAIHGTFY